MERRDNVTVEEVQEAIDNIVFSARQKTEENNTKPSDYTPLFLDSLLSPEVIANPIAYKSLQYLSNFIKDGLIEQDGGIVFETVERMHVLCANTDTENKAIIQELASGLFSHACNAIQGNSSLAIKYLEYLLKSMLREGSDRWNGYSCSGPLLMTRLDSFLPHADLLLNVMLHFPETLSVLHELYQIAPNAFVENMPVMVKLYESNYNGQLSILDIVKDLAKLHPQIVAPHLATLLRIANGAKNDDVITVKEIETSCAGVIVHEAPPPSPRKEIEPEQNEEGDGPEDFDERVDYLNELSTKCHDVPSLRVFIKDNANAIRYLRHVGQVMPLPSGIDYGLNISSAPNSPQMEKKKMRNSIKTSRDSITPPPGKDNNNSTLLYHHEAPRKSCGLSCFGGDSDYLQDFIVLRFACEGGGPKCLTRSGPLSIKSSCPPPWLKLATVLCARSAQEQPSVHIRKLQVRGDAIDALLEVAQGVELAAAAKRNGSPAQEKRSDTHGDAGDAGDAMRSGAGRSVDAFEVLLQPFLNTDDLGDLVVDLRTEGLFSKFSLDVNSQTWTCNECSPSSAQKANVSGFLAKKGRRLGREVKRYYMLDESHLYYASNDKKSKPKRQVPVSDILSIREIPENISLISIFSSILYIFFVSHYFSKVQ